MPALLITSRFIASPNRCQFRGTTLVAQTFRAGAKPGPPGFPRSDAENAPVSALACARMQVNFGSEDGRRVPRAALDVGIGTEQGDGEQRRHVSAAHLCHDKLYTVRYPDSTIDHTLSRQDGRPYPGPSHRVWVRGVGAADRADFINVGRTKTRQSLHLTFFKSWMAGWMVSQTMAALTTGLLRSDALPDGPGRITGAAR